MRYDDRDDDEIYVRVRAKIVTATGKAALLKTDHIEAWVPRACMHAADDLYVERWRQGREERDEREWRIMEWVARREGFV